MTEGVPIGHLFFSAMGDKIGRVHGFNPVARKHSHNESGNPFHYSG
jgi:hypothetical protein